MDGCGDLITDDCSRSYNIDGKHLTGSVFIDRDTAKKHSVQEPSLETGTQKNTKNPMVFTIKTEMAKCR